MYIHVYMNIQHTTFGVILALILTLQILFCDNSCMPKVMLRWYIRMDVRVMSNENTCIYLQVSSLCVHAYVRTCTYCNVLRNFKFNVFAQYYVLRDFQS